MSIRVLVAEDEPTLRHMMLTILSRQGISCALVEDGLSAVESWEKERFDCIIMDVQMPIMDGLQATRMIREKEAVQGGHTLIIATTAFAMEGDRDRCYEAGMDHYMAKPLDLEQLMSLIESRSKP